MARNYDAMPMVVLVATAVGNPALLLSAHSFLALRV